MITTIRNVKNRLKIRFLIGKKVENGAEIHILSSMNLHRVESQKLHIRKTIDYRRYYR